MAGLVVSMRSATRKGTSITTNLRLSKPRTPSLAYTQCKRLLPQSLDYADSILGRWCWDKSDGTRTFDDCKQWALRRDAPVPELHDLKDFWRFFKDQSKGRLGERPTAKSLRKCAKQFKAGFYRHTGSQINDDDTEEINRVRVQKHLLRSILTWWRSG